MEKNVVRKLTEAEIAEIAGGFSFDTDYFTHKRELNIKCPICGAEGTLQTEMTGYDGYSDGTCVAVDNSVCTSCGTEVNIEPERKRMTAITFDGTGYTVNVFPLAW